MKKFLQIRNVLVFVIIFSKSTIIWGQNPNVYGYGTTDDPYGLLNIPQDLTNAVKISVGGYHVIALRANSTVTCWGRGSDNQCNVPAGLTNVIAIAAGDVHSVALRADGKVFAWGANGIGQTNVPADLSDIIAISAGYNFSLALKANGTVVGWGTAPSIPANLNNVTAIAAGNSHGLALKSDGKVIAWGNESANIPSILDSAIVVEISAGDRHNVALLNNGTVVTWGGNAIAQSGIPSVLTNVVAIDAGYNHTTVLKSDNTIVSWGSISTPSILPSGTTKISSGYGFSFLVLGNTILENNFLDKLEVIIAPVITLSGIAGYRYRLDYSDTLGGLATWNPLTNVVMTVQPKQFIDTSARIQANRFYRLIRLP